MSQMDEYMRAVKKVHSPIWDPRCDIPPAVPPYRAALSLSELLTVLQRAKTLQRCQDKRIKQLAKRFGWSIEE